MNLKLEKSEKAIGSTRKAAREFLLKRLGKIGKTGRSSTTGQPGRTADAPGSSGMLEGRAYVDRVRGLMAQTEIFSFLLIKADPPSAEGAGQDPDVKKERSGEISAALASVCKGEAGIWGQMEGGLFGCYLPGSDDRAALELSKKIQQRLNGRDGGSVSIGVAAYPLLDFGMEHIFENARKALAHTAFLGPDSVVAFDAVSLNISGDALYQAGDISGAVKEFKMGLRMDPGEENLHNSLGVCYGEQGNLEAAFAAFEKAVRINPDNVMALHNAGYAKAMLGDPQGALTYFIAADKLNNGLFEVAFHTGKLYVETGHPAKGRPFLERALQLNPDSGPAHFVMGECCREMKLRDLAMASYKKAVKRNPMDAGSLSALGLLYDEKGENPEISLVFSEKSVEISPDNGLYAHRLGCIYESQGEPGKALAMFEKAMAFGYDSGEKLAALKGSLGNRAAGAKPENHTDPVSSTAVVS